MDVRRVRLFTFQYRVMFVTCDNCGHRGQIPAPKKIGAESVDTGRRRLSRPAAVRAAGRARNPSETGILVVHVHAGANVKPERQTALAAGQHKPLRKFTRERVHRAYDRKMLGLGGPPTGIDLFLAEDVDRQVLRCIGLFALVFNIDEIENRPLNAS